MTITLYNKIDYNNKQQADYPQSINNFNEILNYISKTKNKKYENLKDTHKQDIFYELNIIAENKTIINHLKEMAGYREKYILKNIDRIEEEENNDKYHILKFIDENENYFKINTKDIKRLIIG